MQRNSALIALKGKLESQAFKPVPDVPLGKRSTHCKKASEPTLQFMHERRVSTEQSQADGPAYCCEDGYAMLQRARRM